MDRAVSLIGTAYQKDGRGDCGNGVDCANFLAVVLLDLGVINSIPLINTPANFWSDPFFSIENSINRVMPLVGTGFRIEASDPYDVEPGDFLGVTRFRKLDRITHMVIVERVDACGVGILEAVQGFGVQRSRLSDVMRRLAAYRVISNG